MPEVTLGTITLADHDYKQFAAEVERLTPHEPDASVGKLLTRLTQKFAAQWALTRRKSVIERNRPLIEQTLEALSIDPDAGAKWAMLGLTLHAATDDLTREGEPTPPPLFPTVPPTR